MLSLILSGSSALQHVKPGDALELHNGIIFEFYLGLPHVVFSKGCFLSGSFGNDQ